MAGVTHRLHYQGKNLKKKTNNLFALIFMHSKRGRKIEVGTVYFAALFLSSCTFFSPVGYFLPLFITTCVMFSVEISRPLFLPCTSPIGLVLFLFGFTSFVWLVGCFQ